MTPMGMASLTHSTLTVSPQTYQTPACSYEGPSSSISRPRSTKRNGWIYCASAWLCPASSDRSSVANRKCLLCF